MKHYFSHTYTKVLSAVLIAFTTFSCSDTLRDEGFYNLSNRLVYFPSDSIQSFSFGTRFDNEATLNIPVKITGLTPDKNLSVNVRVVENLSTAKLNENYLQIPSNIEISKGQFDGIIPVKLLRGNLSGETLEKVRLVIELENSQDLKAELKNSKRVYVDIDNYLQEPYWWALGWGAPFGNYHPVKFRKMLEDFNNDVPTFEDAMINDYYSVLIKFIKVYDFFKSHPEYGDVFLPQSIYRPYTPKPDSTNSN